jgi:hypothetical protein
MMVVKAGESYRLQCNRSFAETIARNDGNWLQWKLFATVSAFKHSVCQQHRRMSSKTKLLILGGNWQCELRGGRTGSRESPDKRSYPPVFRRWRAGIGMRSKNRIPVKLLKDRVLSWFLGAHEYLAQFGLKKAEYRIPTLQNEAFWVPGCISVSAVRARRSVTNPVARWIHWGRPAFQAS